MKTQHGFRTSLSTTGAAALLAFALAGGAPAASVSTNGLVLADITHPESYNTAMVNITGTAGNNGVGVAFDNGFTADASRWLVQSKSCWAAYEFEAPVVINAYGVWNGNTVNSPATRAPKDFQFLGSNDGINWTTLDQQSGETGWVRAEMRLYRFGNATAYTRYKFNVSANNGDNYTQIHELEFYNVSPTANLEISGQPAAYGTATPAYGTLVGVAGQTLDLSVQSAWTNAEATSQAYCTGWKVYTNNTEDAVWTLVDQGSGFSASFTHPNMYSRFAWQFAVSNAVIVTAATNGTASGTGWYGSDQTVTATAIPDAGYRFGKWIGAVPAGMEKTNPLQFTADMPRSITAVFWPEGLSEPTQFVSPSGSDAADGYSPATAKKTIAAATQVLNAYGEVGGVVRVADGIYPVSSPVSVTNSIRIIGESGDPSRAMVSNTTGSSYAVQERRVFLLSHQDAMLAGLTIAKGEAYNRYGGNVNISTVGGTVSNCVIVAGWARDNGQASGLSADAGLVTHCIFRNNPTGSASTSWDGNRAGVLYAGGSARIENCLIEKSLYSAEAHLTKVSGAAAMRNCTIVNSALTSASTAYGGAYPLYADSTSATIQNVVIAGITNAFGAALGPRGSGTNVMMRCATDTADPINVNCLAGTASILFRDYAAGDYRPSDLLIDQGASLASYPAFDLAGKPRIQGSRIDIGAFEAPPSCFVLIIR